MTTVAFFEFKLIRTATGKAATPLLISLQPPQWLPDGSEASCIVKIDDTAGRPIVGIDPLNALTNALMFVETYLRNLGDVCWENGQGFVDLNSETQTG
jgi:hypothetical protein